MQVYLVGGAVRDQLLGRAPTEHDWVVVGATPEEMQRRGYRAVGRDFPVFLHPVTGEEYALARLERKVGPGYRGFITEHSPRVTLEQDLERRDLRINAMAQQDDGTIIDPFGGRHDLEQRLLRHVSPAFAEDPVRILRVARFSARFAPLGFRIAPETLALMRQMVQAGETAALVPERVWRELERALGEPQPEAFFATLAACGALDTVLPEMVPLWSAATARDGISLPALRHAAGAGCSKPVRMAALVASLPAEQIETFCERLRVPNEYRELALLSARLGAQLPEGEMPQAASAHDPQWLLGLLESADALRRPGRFAQWLEVLGARASASGGSPAAIGASLATLKDAAARAVAVRLDPDAIRDLTGPEIAQRLHHLRLAALGAPQGG